MLISAIEEGEFDGYMFSQDCSTTLDNIGRNGNIPNSWVLLDNQSTVDVFSNSDLLKNIRETKGTLTIHCNAGSAKTNLVGEFDRYGTVWYHPGGIANVLSLAKVKDKYRVTYDSEAGNVFKVHKLNGTTADFVQSKPGLYYLDIQNHAAMLVNTVDDNKSSYSVNAYSQALLARKIQIMIGRPSTKDFIRIVDQGLLPNCPINRDDIKAAENILGPDIGSLKGKTVRTNPGKVRPSLQSIPAEIMSQCKELTLCADIMFVNKIPFLVTLSRRIKFSTAEVLTSRSAKNIMIAITNVYKIYKARGFKINIMLMDNEFETLRGELSSIGITLNTTANDEHVADIERHIRTVKERIRSIYNTLPFTRFPTRLIVEMVYYSVFWINSFPQLTGISNYQPPNHRHRNGH